MAEEQQNESLSLTEVQQETAVTAGAGSETEATTSKSTSTTSTSSSTSLETIYVFHDVLIHYLDPTAILHISPVLRLQLGPKYSVVIDASKRSRHDGMMELMSAIDELPNKSGVAWAFMEGLKKSGNKFIHDVIIGKEKLDDKWELKNLLLKTVQDLRDVPPLHLLPHLTCFENHDQEAIRATHRMYGPVPACAELFLRLQSKHPGTIRELINGLREIGYQWVADSLDNAYKDKDDESRGDPDGNDGDDDNDGGPSQDPDDKKKHDDMGKPNEKDDSGADGNCDDAAGGGGDDSRVSSAGAGNDSGASGAGAGNVSDAGDKIKSGNDAQAEGHNVSQMLQFLDLSDTTETVRSSTATAAEGKPTGTSNEGCSSIASIESLNLHDYQEELAEHALDGKNTVIVAPTGSGKTRVAVAIAIKALTEQEEGARKRSNKVVFVVNKVALVEQQKKAFAEFIPEVVGISGDVSSQVPLVHSLEQADVIVLTAQILLNALQEGSFSLDMLRLIILDECHNTQKENSYNTIMSYYRAEKKEKQQKDLPQVVGLTASLGVKKAKRQIDAVKHVLKLCAYLDAHEISKVVKYKASLEKSYHRPKEVTIGVAGRSDKDPFKTKLGLIMDRIEQGIFSTPDGKRILERHREMKEMSSHRGTQQYEGEVTKLLEYIPIHVNDRETARVLQDFVHFLKIYNESLYINRDARTVDALNYIDSYIQNLKDMTQNTQKSVKSLIALFEKMRPQIEEICQGPSNQNPVLQRLEEILVQEYHEKPETLAILFTNTRDSTKALQAWIQETSSLEFLNPGNLIGTGGNTGMTQTQQEQLLAMFKEKKHKLVISTSVAEEGLDIQMCNLVIRYNYVRDDIGRVQARGRSRKEGGKFYLVFNKGLPKLADRERMNKCREKMMEAATETVCEMIKDKKKEYEENIEELQRLDASERSLQKSGRLAAEKRKAKLKVHNEVKLLCKHCRQFTCYTDDIRCINGQHHIVVKEGFEDTITTQRLIEDQNLYGDVTVSKEIQCTRCKKQLGFMMIFREHELPLLTIKYLVIELPKGVKVQKKKWSETTSIFTIKSIDLEDLAERLKVVEADEDSDDTNNEKEQ